VLDPGADWLRAAVLGFNLVRRRTRRRATRTGDAGTAPKTPHRDEIEDDT
jgi:hypothetical protein